MGDLSRLKGNQSNTLCSVFLLKPPYAGIGTCVEFENVMKSATKKILYVFWQKLKKILIRTLEPFCAKIGRFRSWGRERLAIEHQGQQIGRQPESAKQTNPVLVWTCIVCCRKRNNMRVLCWVFVWGKIVHGEVVTNCRYSVAQKKNACQLNGQSFFNP